MSNEIDSFSETGNAESKKLKQTAGLVVGCQQIIRMEESVKKTKKISKEALAAKWVSWVNLL